MSQFLVFDKSSARLVKVDKIDPKLHAHASSDGIRGQGELKEFTKEQLESIKAQYGATSVVSAKETKE